MTTSKEKKKQPRSPLAMVVATIILLMGVLVLAVSIVSFSAEFWLLWLSIGISGAVMVIFSLLTLITGKSEWILIDLLLPF